MSSRNSLAAVATSIGSTPDIVAKVSDSDIRAAATAPSASALALLRRIADQTDRQNWTAANGLDSAVLGELRAAGLVTGWQRVYATREGFAVLAADRNPCEAFAVRSAEMDSRIANMWSAVPTPPSSGCDDDTYRIWDGADKVWRKAYNLLRAEQRALVSPCGGCLTCTPVPVDVYEGTILEPHCPQDHSACEDCIAEGEFICRDCDRLTDPTSAQRKNGHSRCQCNDDGPDPDLARELRDELRARDFEMGL